MSLTPPLDYEIVTGNEIDPSICADDVRKCVGAEGTDVKIVKEKKYK